MIPVAVREVGDTSNPWIVPCVDLEGQVILDPEEERVGEARGSGFSIKRVLGSRTQNIVNVADSAVELLVTDRRVVLLCQRYDQGGGWAGLGAGGVAFSLIANGISKSKAKRRSQGKVLVAHLRYPWLAAVGGSPKESMFDTKSVLFRAQERIDDLSVNVFLQVDLYQGLDPHLIAADVARRSARFRIEKQVPAEAQREEMHRLASSRPLTSQKGLFAMHEFPRFFYLGKGEPIFGQPGPPTQKVEQ